MNGYVPPSFGWRPDPPDFRDFTPQTQAVAGALRALGKRPQRRTPAEKPRIDLRNFFHAPSDQGVLPASPAHACVALIEYFEQRALGRQGHLSRLFLHHNSRRLAMAAGEHSVNLRATLKAAACCGLPAEDYWSYDPTRADESPPAFLYSFARRFENLQYVRLDGRNVAGRAVLETVRSFLSAGFASVFGLSMPASVSQAAEIPYRPTFDCLMGGQALVAVGYDDRWLSSSRGALLVRNSWGSDWGEGGYGWLPYAFVEERLAVDFWTVLRPDWLASGEFFCPAVIQSNVPRRRQ